ncbi:MAG: hypothetical protein ACOY71_08695 [Gemmatimonadota bacterium]
MAAAIALAVPACAQDSIRTLTWTSRFTFYGDNTEFFTPYRLGETLLGANFSSALSFRPAPRHEVLAGVFGDFRSGDTTSFLTSVRPVLSYRFRTTHSTGVLGTLITERRHGYLEPLEVMQLDITRPIEYGGQWIERRKHLDGEVYFNWQALNTAATREVIDYGWLLTAKPLPWLHIDWQAHGLHRGGQLFDAGEPVRNNFANGLGLRLQTRVPLVDSASVWAYRFWSSGNANRAIPDSLARLGRGTYLRAGIQSHGFQVYFIWWKGKDYLANEGDNNYNSVGHDAAFYRSDRRYLELAVLKRIVTRQGIGTDLELRLHKIDNEGSVALRGSKIEYSYRVVVRVPFDVRVWHDAGMP